MTSRPLFRLHWHVEDAAPATPPDSADELDSLPAAMTNADRPPTRPEPLVPRGYQLELFHRACRENIIAFLETGAGKTLVSALLIRKTLEDLEQSRDLPRSPREEGGEETATPAEISLPASPGAGSTRPALDPESTSLQDGVVVFSKTAKPALPANKFCVFLVHRVPLVPQQADVIRSVMHEHVQVGAYYGEKGVDDWSSSKWANSLRTHKVLVMTAQIFLNLLRHGLLDIRNVALLVLDEVHHATKNHPYRRLFVEFYHTLAPQDPKPRVFGMTATPVKAKAASKSEGMCLDAIVALEVTLDATVVTVSNESLAEVEELVPKPEEFVVTFEGTDVPLDMDDEEANEIDAAVVGTVMEIAASSEAPEQPPSLPSSDKRIALREQEVKLLLFLSWKVGFRAASHFGKQLCASRGIASDETIGMIRRRSSKKELEHGGLPDKIMNLLDVLFYENMRCNHGMISLSEQQKADEFRCILFVKERVTAVALAWLLNDVFKALSCAELSARPAVGVQNTESHVRMTQAKLLDILDDFRVGKFGILVATNVVEEGLDVPACRLVVSFDPVMTPSAYVQGRGRARRRGGRYLSFLEFGSIDDYNALFIAREGARLMSSVAKDGISTDAQRQVHRDKIEKDSNTVEKILFSRTTRAQVSGTEAVNLFSRYCLMKAASFPNDNVERPEYIFDFTDEGYTAHAKVHARIPIDAGICDVPQETELAAKRMAALDAYSKLYQIGEVDEFLLPKRPARSRRVLRVVQQPEKLGDGIQVQRKKRRTQRVVESKESKKGKRLRQCRILHPSSVQYDVTDMLTFDSEADVKEKALKEATRDACSIVGQALKCPASDSRCVDLPKCEHGNRERFLYSLCIDHDTTHFGFHDSSKGHVFGILLKNEVCAEDLKAIQCPTGHELFSLTYEKVIPWSEAKQAVAYKYCRNIQLCLRGKSPGSEAAIEIAERSFGTTTATGFLLVPLSRDHESDGAEVDWEQIEKLLSYGWRSGPLEEGEYRSGQHLQNLLVCSYHEKLNRVYLTGKLSEELRAESHPAGNLNRVYDSFADYFERKHDTVLSDRHQYMLEGFSVLDRLSRLSTSTFMLPPETCRVIPLHPMACYIASLLPRWQTFLAIRSCWRQNRITTSLSGFLPFARALQPNVNNVSRNGADLSYERLEFLGDAVLKVIYSMAAFVMNPHDSEGLLSDERDIEVSNQRLADRALDMNIDDCVAFSGVSQKARAWPWFWATHQSKSIQISEKVLADCVEALIGVQYLEGGVELATIFMDSHKLLPGAARVLGMEANEGSPSGIAMQVPVMSSRDNRKMSAFVREVEEIIGYRFKDRGHLVVALTHGSYKNGSCPSYQRYEYLGDAIIGFLLLSHFFHRYPDLGPGDLTSLRGPALSNDLFARVIVSLKIHERFWYDCSALVPEIDKFERLVANEENDGDDVCKLMTVPKVLGDLLEAIIGAVVVDKGMRLDGVKELVLRLMDAELQRFANPDKFRNSPVSELVHLAQKSQSMLPVYRYLDEPNDVEKVCVILLNDKKIGQGKGPTRRVAKHKAAREALASLRVRMECSEDENDAVMTSDKL